MVYKGKQFKEYLKQEKNGGIYYREGVLYIARQTEQQISAPWLC